MIQSTMIAMYNLNMMRNNIIDFWYIEEKRWFLDDIELHHKLIKIMDLGLSTMVFVFAEDFGEHLDNLLYSYYESKTECECNEIITQERAIILL